MLFEELLAKSTNDLKAEARKALFTEFFTSEENKTIDLAKIKELSSKVKDVDNRYYLLSHWLKETELGNKCSVDEIIEFCGQLEGDRLSSLCRDFLTIEKNASLDNFEKLWPHVKTTMKSDDIPDTLLNKPFADFERLLDITNDFADELFRNRMDTEAGKQLTIPELKEFMCCYIVNDDGKEDKINDAISLFVTKSNKGKSLSLAELLDLQNLISVPQKRYYLTVDWFKHSELGKKISFKDLKTKILTSQYQKKEGLLRMWIEDTDAGKKSKLEDLKRYLAFMKTLNPEDYTPQWIIYSWFKTPAGKAATLKELKVLLTYVEGRGVKLVVEFFIEYTEAGKKLSLLQLNEVISTYKLEECHSSLISNWFEFSDEGKKASLLDLKKLILTTEKYGESKLICSWFQYTEEGSVATLEVLRELLAMDEYAYPKKEKIIAFMKYTGVGKKERLVTFLDLVKKNDFGGDTREEIVKAYLDSVETRVINIAGIVELSECTNDLDRFIIKWFATEEGRKTDKSGLAELLILVNSWRRESVIREYCEQTDAGKKENLEEFTKEMLTEKPVIVTPTALQLAPQPAQAPTSWLSSISSVVSGWVYGQAR